jgi:hypothetical protein
MRKEVNMEMRKEVNMEKISEELRKLFPHGHEKFIELCLKEMELHSKKNHDYASGGHPLGNFYRVAKILDLYPGMSPDSPLTVAIIYLLKQLDALLWMHSNGHSAKVEGPLERCQDISVYAKIIALIIGEKNPAPVESSFDSWNPDSYGNINLPSENSLSLDVYPCKQCGKLPDYCKEEREDGVWYRYRCAICRISNISSVSKKKAQKEWNEFYSVKGSQEKIFSN